MPWKSLSPSHPDDRVNNDRTLSTTVGLVPGGSAVLRKTLPGKADHCFQTAVVHTLEPYPATGMTYDSQ